MSDFLRISPRVTVLPVIHGSGDFAVEVRRIMLSQRFDCLAVPLPRSFQTDVERALAHLPNITLVLQEELPDYRIGEWSPEYEAEAPEAGPRTYSYVPIDPCQPVIAALRIAQQEHLPRAFIDLEVERYEPVGAVLPDPYAVKRISADRFAAAVLPTIPRVRPGQAEQRVAVMARRLHELEQRYDSVLMVCSMTDWPWLREAYLERREPAAVDAVVEDTLVYRPEPHTLLFVLGELPYITALYERARAELDDDENLSIDGVKEMLLAARQRYEEDLKSRARPITPQLLTAYLKYVRNLSLIERRITPDLYTLIVAAQQIAGDQFAVHLAETAREYLPQEWLPCPELRMGIDQAQFPDGEIARLKTRLPGNPVVWRTCRLNRRPPRANQQQWAMRWNPFRQCSWPPEDIAIERFRTHVKDHALAILGHDLARTEKFTTSLKDGLDIRETLRNWHTGDLYVKILPPNRGSLDCVIMLFDSPADPRRYPWRITWHAEAHDESTLSFFATDFGEELVGPGIALATYGGAMFLFPPRPIDDIWRDRAFDFTDTLEERLLAAACHHAQERHIALLAHAPPGAGWRRLVKKYGKRLIHVPLSHFSQQTVQQLRMFHVLNGREVRSYAEHFIRRA